MAYLFLFFISFAFIGLSQSANDAKEVIEGYEFVKAVYDDVQRGPVGPNLLRAASSTDEKCFPEIGCFSPSTGIVTEYNLHVDSPEKIDTTFRLYTRTNRSAPLILDYIDKTTLDTHGFDPNVPLIFIIHGMNENGMVQWILDIKNAILDRSNVSVVTVDWGKGCPLPFYAQGIVNAELVSRQLARLLTSLKTRRGLDIRKTHLIGYSLGAHLSGFTAKFLKEEGEYIGRITGLDPAGPNFESKDETLHLSYKDADYVDVIHTSAGDNILTGNMGMTKPIGHVDFYPNGGSDQPGCGFFQFVCSHRRAVLLYLESVRFSCNYESHACKSYAEYKEGKCLLNTRANMGYYSNSASTPSGTFYLNTTGEAPYC